jgi:hypothetical protein
MKTRIVIGSLMATIMAFQVLAQGTENDDMYFNSKDREKLRAEKGTASVSVNDKIDSDYNSFRKKHFDKNEEAAETVKETANPTDSYSARTINPEYISRSNSEQASEDENYYVEGYVPANTYDSYSANTNDNNNNWNNYNNGYNGNYGYGYPNSSLYSPYYGSCNPWMMNPYAGGSGLAFSLGYMWGSPGWNYGMSYGYGNSYYNPYNNYPSYYSPYYGGSSPGYYYGGSESTQPNYGKRPSRHSAVVSPTPRSSERTRTIATNDGTNGRSRQVDEYYVKPLKRATIIDSYINSSRGSSGERYVRPSSDYPASRSRDSYNSSNTTKESRSSYSTPSRSSSSDVSRPSSSGSSSGRSSSPASRKRD